MHKTEQYEMLAKSIIANVKSNYNNESKLLTLEKNIVKVLISVHKEGVKDCMDHLIYSEHFELEEE